MLHHKNVLCAKSLQSCPTLCDPMNCSLSGSSVHGILQARTPRAPGKSGLHARGEGERVLALESREGTRASRRVEEGLSTPPKPFSVFSAAKCKETLFYSLVAQLVKNPPAMRETWVQSLDWEDPLEKGTATYSSILAWRIPWTVQSCTVIKSWTRLSGFHRPALPSF